MEKRQRPSLSSAHIAWLDSSEDEEEKKKPAVASFQTASSLLQKNSTFASTANGNASAKRALSSESIEIFEIFESFESKYRIEKFN